LTGGVDLSDEGSILSGTGYGSNADCQWKLTCSQANFVPVLTFSSFDVEATYDYVNLFNGGEATGNPVQVLHGTTVPNAVTWAGQALTVQLTSDDSEEGAGFEASFTCTCDCACDTHTCDTGYKLKPEPASIAGADDAACCDTTCQLHTCDAGAKKSDPETIVGATDLLCCDATCETHTCDTGYKLKPEPASLAGADDATCCDGAWHTY
jgi:hypothetical protein